MCRFFSLNQMNAHASRTTALGPEGKELVQSVPQFYNPKTTHTPLPTQFAKMVPTPEFGRLRTEIFKARQRQDWRLAIRLCYVLVDTFPDHAGVYLFRGNIAFEYFKIIRDFDIRHPVQETTKEGKTQARSWRNNKPAWEAFQLASESFDRAAEIGKSFFWYSDFASIGVAAAIRYAECAVVSKLPEMADVAKETLDYLSSLKPGVVRREHYLKVASFTKQAQLARENGWARENLKWL